MSSSSSQSTPQSSLPLSPLIALSTAIVFVPSLYSSNTPSDEVPGLLQCLCENTSYVAMAADTVALAMLPLSPTVQSPRAPSLPPWALEIRTVIHPSAVQCSVLDRVCCPQERSSEGSVIQYSMAKSKETRSPWWQSASRARSRLSTSVLASGTPSPHAVQGLCLRDPDRRCANVMRNAWRCSPPALVYCLLCTRSACLASIKRDALYAAGVG